ncbi:MAG: hypothetical protein K5894_02905 [Lachnospiraceae bacterium]|nr:hypothetical protein [Lachnospiraceae bacterium]
MKNNEFLEQLIIKYHNKTGRDLSDEDLGLYLMEILYSGSGQELNRKTAARISYEFIKEVLGYKDMNWGIASKLKDIYECRVCANAVAQVYVRGIMSSLTDDFFGLNEIVREDEMKQIMLNILELA